MYGLEKNKDKFRFDLEVEISEDPQKGKDLIKKVESRITELKTAMREGEKDENFKDLEKLLTSYQSAEKILKKAIKE